MNAINENMDWEMTVRKYLAKLVENVMIKITNGCVDRCRKYSGINTDKVWMWRKNIVTYYELQLYGIIHLIGIGTRRQIKFDVMIIL